MAAGNAFNIFAVQKAAVVIGGVTAASMPVGNIVGVDITSGELYPQIVFLRGQAPTFNFTTKDIATALTQFPIIGTDMSSSAFSMWGQKKKDGSTRSEITDHEKWTVNGGIIVPTTLSVAGQDDAEISYTGFITFNDPVAAIVRTTAALPAGVTDANRYALGALTVAGSGITGIDSFNLAFGIVVQTEVTDGDITPTFAAIGSISPILTWTGIDATLFGTIGLDGIDSTTTVTTQVLRHRLKGGGFGGSDMTVTARGLVTVENVFDGAGNDTGKVNLQLTAYYDNTNVPVAIA